jgi:cell division protein ZapA (FtsZ GTPase activity inhibitor)
MSNPEPHTVRVKIYDREYSLRTTGDPERLRSLCLDLDRRMREAAAGSGAVDTLKVAILAGLGLAEELCQVRAELVRMDESVSRRSKECASLLERCL